MFKNYKLPILGFAFSLLFLGTYLFFRLDPNASPLTAIFSSYNTIYAFEWYVLSACVVGFILSGFLFYAASYPSTKNLTRCPSFSELFGFGGLLCTLVAIICGVTLIGTTISMQNEKHAKIANLELILDTDFTVSLGDYVTLASPRIVKEEGTVLGKPYQVFEKRTEVSLYLDEAKRLESYLKANKLSSYNKLKEAVVAQR